MKHVIVIATAMLLLAACNTIQGIGQDLKDGGKAMDHAINGSSSSSEKPKDY